MAQYLQRMHTLAKQAMLRAYAPYSNFYVGACILTNKGNMYSGCNIENASYPCSSCAENSAIAQMVVFGEKNIKEILVMGGMNGITNNNIVSPCGQCRQKINEFANGSCIIHIANTSKILISKPLTDLLPYSFGPSNLN